MPLATTAEVKKHSGDKPNRQFGWIPVSIEKALLDRDQFYRCQKCKARVRPHKASSNQGAHFEHEVEFDGCELSQAWSGVAKVNPRAMD